VSTDSADSRPGQAGCGATPRCRARALARFARIAAAGLIVGTAHPAIAAPFFSPFAMLGYQHDSNVFMRPSSAPAFAAEGITALGDSILDLETGFGSELDWGADRLTLDASATRDQYDRFSFLNHYEYLLDGKFDWRLAPVIDGTVTYEQSRYMPSFTYTFTTALLLDTERTASVAVRVLMTPQWRLELTPELHEVSTPLPGFADFKLHETTGIAGLEYLGFGRLTAGLQFTYDTGRNEDIAAATRYQQREFALTANYKLGGFSTFSATAGYTSRNSEANPADSVQAPAGGGIFPGFAGLVGKTSSSTGSLSYQRQFTGKTSGTLSFFRRVESYAAGANPEIGTGGAVGMAWQADPKIRVRLNYSLARDQIEGGLVILNAVNRSDRTQTAEFEARYQALSWFTIGPYVSWSKARSNFELGNYSATTLGVDVTARLRW
jgi:hypothetical protein